MKECPQVEHRLVINPDPGLPLLVGHFACMGDPAYTWVGEGNRRRKGVGVSVGCCLDGLVCMW